MIDCRMQQFGSMGYGSMLFSLAGIFGTEQSENKKTTSPVRFYFIYWTKHLLCAHPKVVCSIFYIMFTVSTIEIVIAAKTKIRASVP